MRLILFLVAGLAAVAGVFADAPLNIVVLYADDWRHDTLGASGNTFVRTPNLDRLAQQGVRFSNAAVTTALCGPSRASFYTGQWMSRHGNRAFKAFTTPWSETFPGQMRSHGYMVAHVGKWHCGKFPQEEFDFGRSYQGEHWITPEKGRKVHVTEQNESDALEFLRSRDTGRPFCLTVAFFAPHAEDRHPLQYLPQPASYDLFTDERAPVPSNASAESLRRLPPFLADDANEGRNRWRWRFDTPGKYQAMMKNYFRLVAEVDAACGRILDELDRQGLAGSTLVIFTTDNGYFHGEHGLADKWYPFEESIRVPLIVRDPRLADAARGAVRTEWVLNVDLAPTILSAAGLSAPAGMQGRDLTPLVRGESVADWRTEFFYEHPTLTRVDLIPSSEALVSLEWKYMRWPDFGREQLFHLTSDPHEENDLAAVAAHADRLAHMRARCDILKDESL